MAGVPAGRLNIEIVAEIARLQTDLDKAKKMVSAASGDIAKSAKAANDNLAGMSGGMAKIAPNAKLAAFGMKNLAFQAQDLGVQLASAAGSSAPLRMSLMALVQQGPQIKDAMNQAGLGVGGLAALIGKLALRFAPLVAVVGTAYGAFKLFTSEVEKSGELDRYAASLGLTAKEMEKLEGVGVTASDTFKGLWRVLDRYTDLSGKFATVKAFIVDAFKTGLNWVMNFAAGAYAAVMGTVKVFGTLATAAKQVMSGDFAGALTTVVTGRVMDGYASAFKDAKDRLRALGGEIGQEIIGASKERIAGQASKIINDRAEKKMKDKAKEAGSILAEVMAGTFLANFAMKLEKEINVKVDWGGETDLRRQMEDIEAVREGQERIDEFYKDMDRRARERALETAYEIADIIGGGVGGAIKNLADALDKAFPDFMAKMGTAIDKMMGSTSGKFAAILKQFSEGAAIGDAADGIMKGIGIKSSNTGAQIGGAIGGAAFGPIGAIAGSILGGVVGGLLKKTKKASATIEIMAGEAMQTSLSGNSSKLKKVAGAMADSLISGLSGIADQLGGMLGDGIKVSIGQHDKTFRVDLQGLGRTKNMPKFDTEAEAVAFAIQEVIRRGAIIGLRAGTEALLKGEGELQAQLEKAMAFEQVFKDLESAANPTKASIEAITKQFAQLIDIFDEAGASAEDFGKLQELMALRQREVIEQAFEPIRTMLDDLKAKADTAGDAVRTAFQAVLQREADAVNAYQQAVAEQAQAQAEAAREAFNTGQKRWLDAVTTGFTEEIARVKDAMGPLRDEVDRLSRAAQSLRDFADGLFGGSGAAGRVRFSASAASAAAQAGDIDRLQSLRDAAMSGATDRVSMVRNLATLRNAANGAANGLAGQASAVQAQITAMERQVAGIEQQVELAKSQVRILEKVKEASEASAGDLSALRQTMEQATAAADVARATMEKLGILPEVQQTFAEAVAAYEAAKAARDDMIRQITEAGFANMIEAQKQTGTQLIGALSQVAAMAAKAMADASGSIAAVQAAQAAAQVANDNRLYGWNGYIPGFANGGMHGGGLRIVGERNWEVEATGPARYWTADQVATGGVDVAGEIRAMGDRLDRALYQIAKNTGKAADTLDDWEGIGMPDTRSAA